MERHLVVIICLSFAYVPAESTDRHGILGKTFNRCDKEDFVRCLKLGLLKIANRALHANSLNIVDGVSIVSTPENGEVRNFFNRYNGKEEALEKLNASEMDDYLSNAASHLLSTRKVQINLPALLEEGRKRKKGKRHSGLFMAALAVKGAFLAMAYKGIAALSGTALLIGKMTLLLTAILGLKELMHGGREKTKFEIVKYPHYSHSHTYSSSHDDEDEGNYYRPLDSKEEMVMQEKVYRRYIPRN